jgi:hypothetical protein
VPAFVSSVPIEQPALSLRDVRLYGLVAVFAAGNLLLPMAVHTVPQGGLIFLPIFFCTLLAAYRFGLAAGVMTAVVSPVLNHALTGMPPAEMLVPVLAKSLLLAAIAVFLARRTGRLSPLWLFVAAAGMQVAGFAIDISRGVSSAVALDTLRLGIPGVLMMAFGGYAVLRLLARTGLGRAADGDALDTTGSDR